MAKAHLTDPRSLAKIGDITFTVDQIESGLPAKVIFRIGEKTGLGDVAIRKLSRISSSSFARRQKSGKLSVTESDRVARLQRILTAAADFFEGDLEETHRWLQTPAPALRGKKPIDMLINDAGVKEVEDLLIRLEHGVFT